MLPTATTFRLCPVIYLINLMSLVLVPMASAQPANADGPDLEPPAVEMTTTTTPVGAIEIADLQRRLDLLSARLTEMEAVLIRISDIVERLEARATSPPSLEVAQKPQPATHAPLASDWPVASAQPASAKSFSIWGEIRAAPQTWLRGLGPEALRTFGFGLLGIVTLVLATITCSRVSHGIA
ncbi:MAG: hypothetical protein ACYS15_10430 [Planctomycetota bacterium]|jgi:hypothetical protein